MASVSGSAVISADGRPLYDRGGPGWTECHFAGQKQISKTKSHWVAEVENQSHKVPWRSDR
jgi:hypothetical protein